MRREWRGMEGNEMKIKENRRGMKGNGRKNERNRDENEENKWGNIMWIDFKGCELDLSTGLLGSWLSIP